MPVAQRAKQSLARAIAQAIVVIGLLPSVAWAQAAETTCAISTEYHAAARFADLPPAVRRNALGDGAVVEAGRPTFGPPDFNFNLPVRQFVRAGQVGDRLFVWLRYSFFSRHANEVLWYTRDPRELSPEWRRNVTLQGNPCTLIDAFLTGAENPFETRHKPLTYRDSGTGVVFFVDRDGRHVTAVDPAGKVLWDVDPFAGHEQPYRVAHPIITYIGRGPYRSLYVEDGDKIGICFSSSQFGTLNISDGTYTSMGRD